MFTGPAGKCVFPTGGNVKRSLLFPPEILTPQRREKEVVLADKPFCICTMTAKLPLSKGSSSVVAATTYGKKKMEKAGREGFQPMTKATMQPS